MVFDSGYDDEQSTKEWKKWMLGSTLFVVLLAALFLLLNPLLGSLTAGLIVGAMFLIVALAVGYVQWKTRQDPANDGWEAGVEEPQRRGSGAGEGALETDSRQPLARGNAPSDAAAWEAGVFDDSSRRRGSGVWEDEEANT
ncbi:MAG TPA: hypothetical protein VJB02_02750, partial [Coxiellaceae bacterium]|nr:hypothetical protein [Coxiellaceae bacterium]